MAPQPCRSGGNRSRGRGTVHRNCHHGAGRPAARTIRRGASTTSSTAMIATTATDASTTVTAAMPCGATTTAASCSKHSAATSSRSALTAAARCAWPRRAGGVRVGDRVTRARLLHQRRRAVRRRYHECPGVYRGHDRGYQPANLSLLDTDTGPPTREGRAVISGPTRPSLRYTHGTSHSHRAGVAHDMRLEHSVNHPSSLRINRVTIGAVLASSVPARAAAPAPMKPTSWSVTRPRSSSTTAPTGSMAPGRARSSFRPPTASTGPNRAGAGHRARLGRRRPCPPTPTTRSGRPTSISWAASITSIRPTRTGAATAPAIGVATNTTLDPRRGWIRVSSSARRRAAMSTAIDPCIFEDAEGKPWLSYGSYFSGIKLIQIDPATGKQLGTRQSTASPPIRAARRERSKPPASTTTTATTICS